MKILSMPSGAPARNFILEGNTIYYPYSVANGNVTTGADYVQNQVTGGDNSFKFTGVDLTGVSTLRVKMAKTAGTSYGLISIGTSSILDIRTVTASPAYYNFDVSAYTGIKDVSFGGTVGTYQIYEIELIS